MNKIIAHHGELTQLVKSMEEAAEYIQALAKYVTTPTDLQLFKVKEEMADLSLMLEQVRVILNIKNSDMEWMKEQKISREHQRIDDNLGKGDDM